MSLLQRCPYFHSTLIYIPSVLGFIRVDDNFIVKVSDFGLYEDENHCNCYEVPSIKWTALESIHAGQYSEKSDVVSILIIVCVIPSITLVVFWSCLLGGIYLWC